MRRPITVLAGLIFAATIVAGCAFLAAGTSSPAPTPGPARSIPELKLALVDAYGLLWYCDPDFYPVAHGEEIDNAKARWSEVVADTVAFRAIATKLGLDPAASFTDAQKLSVYQAWKALQAIALNPIGNDSFRFDYLAQPRGGAAEGTRSAGTITMSGAITVEQQAAAGAPNCPICLARGTRIDTPTGGTVVEGLRIGDIVWTLDARGSRIQASVIEIGRASCRERVYVLV